MLKTNDKPVKLMIDSITLDGLFSYKPENLGVVIFAHGAGSGWQSPRENFVAKQLQARSIGTLLVSLLTEEEDQIYENRFDIGLLTERLLAATNWVLAQSDNKDLPLGYFGASTGAAAMIQAAVAFDANVKAIVSRGGRPDLARDDLKFIEAPTLFIVGDKDPEVWRLNQEAFFLVRSIKQFELIKGAGHLFEEPGALEQVASISADWFEEYLCPEEIKKNKDQLVQSLK